MQNSSREASKIISGNVVVDGAYIFARLQCLLHLSHWFSHLRTDTHSQNKDTFSLIH